MGPEIRPVSSYIKCHEIEAIATTALPRNILKNVLHAHKMARLRCDSCVSLETS